MSFTVKDTGGVTEGDSLLLVMSVHGATPFSLSVLLLFTA